ncbi:aldose epimerase family protein [Peptoniphilaceae bacterium SGI.137]
MTNTNLSFFDTTADGQKVFRIQLRNSHQDTAAFLSYGAALSSFIVSEDSPDPEGRPVNLVLGYDTLKEYEANDGCFGAIVGPFANRIAGARYSIGENRYTIPSKNDIYALHGGSVASLHDKVWDVESVSAASVTFCYHAQDGEGGFPGNRTFRVKYTLTDARAIQIEYYADTDRDTILNLCNHSYFTLSITGGIKNCDVEVCADFYTPTDSDQIPTGEIRCVAGSDFDLRSPRSLSKIFESENPEIMDVGNGLDHNFVLTKTSRASLQLAARLSRTDTAHSISIYTTEPGVQVYTANWLTDRRGDHERRLRKYSGICFETQKFPDTPHHKNFPDAILKANHSYRSTTIFQYR